MSPALKTALEIMVLGDRAWTLFISYHELDWYLMKQGWVKSQTTINTLTYTKDGTTIFLVNETQHRKYKRLLDDAMWVLSRQAKTTPCGLAKTIVEEIFDQDVKKKP